MRVGDAPEALVVYVMSLSDMRTYVINLPRATDRREAMERQLATSDLDYEFVEAIEGRNLSADEYAELVDHTAVERWPHWLTPGAIGCLLSHRRVLEMAAERDEPSLILEDDAVLSPHLAAACAAWPVPVGGVVLLNFR